jgi:2-hydroxychromene-2-carboxylate isomerase
VGRVLLRAAQARTQETSSRAPQTKRPLTDAIREAVGRDVFGAPAYIVGDEMFFGNDRLHFVEAALERS